MNHHLDFMNPHERKPEEQIHSCKHCSLKAEYGQTEYKKIKGFKHAKTTYICHECLVSEYDEDNSGMEWDMYLEYNNIYEL